MKANTELLGKLKDISKQIELLSADRDKYEFDTDAIVDLNIARDSVDKLINRVERIVQ